MMFTDVLIICTLSPRNDFKLDVSNVVSLQNLYIFDDEKKSVLKVVEDGFFQTSSNVVTLVFDRAINLRTFKKNLGAIKDYYLKIMTTEIQSNSINTKTPEVII